MDRAKQARRSSSPPTPLYQTYSLTEEKRRINSHYEIPAEFFALITGGEWNVYSGNVWTDNGTETESQAAKLDLLARLLELKPGERILDVGCGWGGPLVYLCQTYGVQGVGLTVSSSQKQAAEARIAHYGANAQIVESHWQNYEDAQGFDVIYSDEAIVHFTALKDFFLHCYTLLRDKGRMAHKELHFTHARYSRLMPPAAAFINEIFGATGNYRTLAEELTLVGEAGFEVQSVFNIPCQHYRQTLDRWLSNMHQYKGRLEALVGSDYYRQFRMYLKLGRRHLVGGHMMTLDVVLSHKYI